MMGPSPPKPTAGARSTTGNADVVERAIRRVNGIIEKNADHSRQENTAALVVYLFENGVNDEDELVELATIAEGRHYDPVAGIFN